MVDTTKSNITKRKPLSYLGIRCSPTDYSYVILSGSKKTPKFVNKGKVSFPDGYSRAESLRWFFRDIEIMIAKYSISGITVKELEGKVRRKLPYQNRVEKEAMVFLAASNAGIKNVFGKVNSTIAKDIGLKGKGKYLKTRLDCSFFPNFTKENEKVKDALHAAWSSMK